MCCQSECSVTPQQPTWGRNQDEGTTLSSHLRLQEVHGRVAAGLLAVHLHTPVDPFLECLHHPLPEDEGDHDGDQLDQIQAAQTQRILKPERGKLLRLSESEYVLRVSIDSLLFQLSTDCPVCPMSILRA